MVFNLTFKRQLLSCNSYVCAFNLTLGKVWGLGVDSKLVLNNESINVDLPSPVSPTKAYQMNNGLNYTLLCHVIENEVLKTQEILTNTQNIENKSILNGLVYELVWQTVEADVPWQLQVANRCLNLKNETKLNLRKMIFPKSNRTTANFHSKGRKCYVSDRWKVGLLRFALLLSKTEKYESSSMINKRTSREQLWRGFLLHERILRWG